jgi:hypothetical protein
VWRPRRDRDEGYTLHLFDADCTHAEAARELGGSNRIVAVLLVRPDCTFDLYPWNRELEGLAGIVENLEPRLKQRSDDRWSFISDEPA